MKKILSCVFGILMLLLAVKPVFGQGVVHVKGYYRNDGTYVHSYFRTAPDGNFYNNWSTYGNINPYTGKVGTKKNPSENSYRSYNHTFKRHYITPSVGGCNKCKAEL